MFFRIIIFVCALTTGAVAQVADPSPRELLAIINERGKALEQRFIEREKANNQRNEAQEKANSQRFEAQEKATAKALDSAERATNKAEAAAEKRFDSVNEFRSTLKDQQTTLATKTEVDIRFKGQDEKIKALDEKIVANSLQITQAISRAEGASQTWGYITVGMGFLFAGLTAFVTFRNRRRAT